MKISDYFDISSYRDARIRFPCRQKTRQALETGAHQQRFL
jgi:hypothetical protein